MAYDNTEPGDNILIRLLPGSIRDNFQAIDSADATFKPDAINFGVQGAAPAALATVYKLYSKLATNGITELFGKNENSDEVQLTTGAVTITATDGSTFLPGGLILKWGKANVATTAPIAFSPAFPNNLFNVTVTKITSTGNNNVIKVSAAVTDFIPASFKISESNVSIFWTAIGN